MQRRETIVILMFIPQKVWAKRRLEGIASGKSEYWLAIIITLWCENTANSGLGYLLCMLSLYTFVNLLFRESNFGQEYREEIY